MAANNLWVYVDDTDPDINYVGNSWSTDIGSQDSQGNFGPAHRSTQHVTKSSASLSFSFNGSAVMVSGTTAVRNDSGVVDPKWECFVDNISIGFQPQVSFVENRWAMCLHDSLKDGPHTITVNATIAKSQPFWFDYVQYVPSKSVLLYNKTVVMDHTHPTMQYGAGWGNYANIANITSKAGSVFTYEFYGTSVAWYGYIASELNGNATTGTWSIDGGAAQTFALNGHPVGGISTYNQKFFETTTYPVGHHKLSVGYNGKANTTPMILSYLMVQNGTAPIPSSTPPPHKKGTNIGAIVGGVVGGLLFILLLAIGVVFFRRRRRHRQSTKPELIDPDDLTTDGHVVEPFRDFAGLQGTSSTPSQPRSWGLGTTSKAGTSFPSYSPLPTSRSSHEEASRSSPAHPVGGTQASAEFISEKAREAGVTTAQTPLSPHRHIVNASSSSVTPSSGSADPPQGIHRTQDSGIRLGNQQVERPVLELPPEYTPS